MKLCGFYAMIKVDMPYAKSLEDAVLVSQELVDELVFDELIDTNTLDLYVKEVGKVEPVNNKYLYED